MAQPLGFVFLCFVFRGLGPGIDNISLLLSIDKPESQIQNGNLVDN